MTTRSLALVSLVSLAVSVSAQAQQTTFEKVQVRFAKSDKDPRLVEKDATLIFDDGAKKLTVKSSDHPVTAAYADVEKVIVEETMRPKVIMRQVTGAKITAHWLYVESKSGGATQPVLLLIPEDSSSKVTEKAKAVFGSKLTVADFADKSEDVKKETLKDIDSKHDMTVDKKNHPQPPAAKPDKALLVIMCGPPLVPDGVGEGNQVKLHANDRVVAVNKLGTYAFAYLDPGEYQLAAQVENASGMKMKLEAGQEYYLFEDFFYGTMKNQTGLSRHTKELVMYEIGGAYYSDWTRK